MKPRLNATRAVRELIKAYEPFVATAERRGRRWVLGWGHRATAREGAMITPDNAELLLIYDALQAQQAVEAVVGSDMPKPARDALASFAASIGLSAFKVSDVARLAKAGHYQDAAAALDGWVRSDAGGQLAVSDRLVERRRAEKTLFLEAITDAPDDNTEPAPEPAAEPTLGALVDVDIAFEEEPVTVVDATPAEPEDALEAEEPADDLLPLDDAQADAEARAAIEATSSDAGELPEPPAVPEVDEGEDLKVQQDAAIKAVMARMAGDIAASVVPVPALDTPEEPQTAQEPEPEADLSEVKLGFSYMEPATVEVAVEPAGEVLVEAEPVVEDSAPQSEPEPEPEPEPAPTPVYATVSLGPVPTVSAPPHPSMAPASAPGLSGESEGPDHPEDDDTDAGFDDDILDPAIVAGPEAGEPDAIAQPQKSANWVFPAMLGVGVLMTGLGAWELASNWQAYVAEGPGYSPIGPVVFGSGLLLSVGAGWMTLSRR